ncbi:MAG: hypothetical protein A2Y56_14450 [Candidatus Aminicenantes bacterium RBG_13_63_10]|nr:MAG: hypothetical protein A2Y56_14450 [Candidatus Aminicenantes bacterium RBG_13_63_10]
MRVILKSSGFILLAALILISGIWSSAAAQSERSEGARDQQISAGLFSGLAWRNIGPANMGGRVTDVEGVPGNLNVVYVAAASGGVWKTTDGGLTWKPIFDGAGLPSIGDIALEPGNPEVLYVGTGEANPRNSVSFGDGVYKSTDGGATWTHLGLEDTRAISRVVVNPRQPHIVLVGALGHVYGPNKDRGVFLSQDGGKTWDKVLYTDERHGVADLDIDLQNPNIVFAALWRFERKPWTFWSGDEEGGLWKSTDAGRTWKKVTRGLPRLVGRIGVKVSPSNPRVVYAMTESPEGTLYRSDDGGESFRCVSKDPEIVSRGFYYTDLRVDPSDENRVYAVSSRLMVSIDGGRTFSRISASTHVDYHALWIDPLNPSRMWQGQDGGLGLSTDRGRTWRFVDNIPIAQFYQVCADSREPFYYIGGGLQDNGTWYGPSRSKEPAGILNDDWRMISSGDGFHVAVHPDNPDLFLSEFQAGGLVRTDMRTREQQGASPQPRRADGAPVSQLKYRFNWNTPIIPSPHDRKTVYLGANVVFKSQDFGSSWKIISPDLTAQNPERQKGAGGPAWPENTTAEYYGTIISLAESPFQAGIIWAGTDDGNLHVTQDGGKTWTSVVKNVSNLPSSSPVSAVEPSWTDPAAAYCAFDRHMLDDPRPLVYRTKDFGKTWTSISGNLPDKAYVWVIREDLENPGLIFAGTELGLFASFNGGNDWIRFHGQNLPPVAVHDILIHLRENDLILGTHGRGLWVFDDITCVQQLNAGLLDQPAVLFDIRPAVRHTLLNTRYGIGDSPFRGKNPPYGALITYYLKAKAEQGMLLKVEILDASGKVIRMMSDLPASAGLNRTSWDLRAEPPRPRVTGEAPEENEFRPGPRGPQVPPGTYTVKLTAGTQSLSKTVEVKLDPTVAVTREDLRLQYRYGLRLREMESVVNEALSALDGVVSQVEDRKRTQAALVRSDRLRPEALKTVQDILAQAEGLKNGLVKPKGKPFWSEGPRLLERVSSLFQDIDRTNAAPTAPQLTYWAEMVIELREDLVRINGFLEEGVKKLNSALDDLRLPAIVAPEPVRMPELEKIL